MARALLQYHQKVTLECLDPDGNVAPPPAPALPVYVRALVDITQQHPAFLRAAKPLACLDNMAVARLAVLLTYAKRTDCSLTAAFLSLVDAIGKHVHLVMGWDQTPLATWESEALALPKTLLTDFFEPEPTDALHREVTHFAWWCQHVRDLGKVVFAHIWQVQAEINAEGLGSSLADIMSYWLDKAAHDDEDAPGIGKQYLLHTFRKHDDSEVVDDVPAQVERMWSPDTLTSASSCCRSLSSTAPRIASAPTTARQSCKRATTTRRAPCSLSCSKPTSGARASSSGRCASPARRATPSARAC